MDDFASGKSKRTRVEEAWAVPKELLQRLVVAEVWPDKRNVVVVGNGKN